jgi:hypothetical protein
MQTLFAAGFGSTLARTLARALPRAGSTPMLPSAGCARC